MATTAFFELTASGDVQVSRRLERFAHRAEDASPLWREIMGYLERIEQVQFQSEGKFSGGWPELADSTIQAKGHDQILYLTGRLWESLTGGNGDSIREIGEDEMAFGTTTPYAVHHQFGSADGEHPPMRKPTELAEYQRKGIAKALQRWVQNGEHGVTLGGVR